MIKMYYNKTIFGCLSAVLLIVSALQCLQAQVPGGIGSGYNYYPLRGGYRNPNPVYQVQPGYYTHYPTDRTTRYQQAVAPASDIQGMNAEVEDATNAIDNVDILTVSDEKKQREFINHQNVVKHLIDRFGEEYRRYINMLQRNDPMLRTQEENLRKAFMSFKTQYKSFMKEVQ